TRTARERRRSRFRDVRTPEATARIRCCGPELGEGEQAKLDAAPCEGDKVVVEIVELDVGRRGRDVEHALDPERREREGAGKPGNIAIVELGRVVAVPREALPIDDERGALGPFALPLRGMLRKRWLVIGGRGEREMRGHDAARMRPIVEDENRYERVGERGR